MYGDYSCVLAYMMLNIIEYIVLLLCRDGIPTSTPIDYVLCILHILCKLSLHPLSPSIIDPLVKFEYTVNPKILVVILIWRFGSHG